MSHLQLSAFSFSHSSRLIPPLGGQRPEVTSSQSLSRSSLSDVLKLKLESDLTVHGPFCEATNFFFLSSQQGGKDTTQKTRDILFTERIDTVCNHDRPS